MWSSVRAHRERNNRGVTLIELLVTLAVAGVVLALALPSFMGVLANAADSSVKSRVLLLANFVRDFGVSDLSKITSSLPASGPSTLVTSHGGSADVPSGFSVSADVMAGTYCVDGQEGLSGTWHMDQSLGAPASGACMGGGSGRPQGVSLIAGDQYQHFLADGSGSSARFSLQQYAAMVPSTGLIYSIDFANGYIALRQTTQGGAVTTVAGHYTDGANNPTPADGNGVNAVLGVPKSLAYDSVRNLVWWTDMDYNTWKMALRTYDPSSGDVTTVYSASVGAQFQTSSAALFVGSDGTVYVREHGWIRTFDPSTTSFTTLFNAGSLWGQGGGAFLRLANGNFVLVSGGSQIDIVQPDGTLTNVTNTGAIYNVSLRNGALLTTSNTGVISVNLTSGAVTTLASTSEGLYSSPTAVFADPFGSSDIIVVSIGATQWYSF